MVTPDLHIIAAHLEGLEETIISKLIDRAQYKANAMAYKAGVSGFQSAASESLFDLRMRYQEQMDAEFGRFCVPEERPFTANLPAPRRTVLLRPNCLAIADFDVVNLSAEIKKAYMAVVPVLCAEGDDGQYGSSVEHDVYALQAIARRIHYGALYIAECKFRAEPSFFAGLITQKDIPALYTALTRKDVEEKILLRIKDKVNHIQSAVDRSLRSVIDPEAVLCFYRDSIIPLTKDGEVRYLLSRTLSGGQGQ